MINSPQFPPEQIGCSVCSERGDSQRMESDALGSLPVPADALWGIHTARAIRNFPVSGQRMPDTMIVALAQVKQACARTNHMLGFLDDETATAIEHACAQIIAGQHHDQFPVDAYQGGAGTSANMNANEVIANLAGRYRGHPAGSYVVSPLGHVNLHQSTNDVFPTALRVALLRELTALEPLVEMLQRLMQQGEERFRSVVKVGRTQLRDAVPMTLGMTFGAWAEAFARDRWRVFKARERIRQVNLGGTAIGTGLGAPREYILRVVDELRRVTGLKITRAENLLDATQNADSFVEMSGMLKPLATNLYKISTDLRILSSGPAAGIGEISLPPVQAGSSIMPAKVNPVIPEAVSQAALRVMHNDALAASIAASGNFELNQFLPLMAHCLLESLQLLCGACRTLADNCLKDIQVDTTRCQNNVDASNALATVLVPALGYETVSALVEESVSSGIPLSVVVAGHCGVDENAVEALLKPERMHQLGYTPATYALFEAVHGKEKKGE